MMLSPLAHLQDELNKEMANWHAHGISPDSMQADTFTLSAQIHAFIEYCVETGRVDKDELNIRFMRLYLQRLKEARMNIVVQMAKSPIVGPDGQPINLKKGK